PDQARKIALSMAEAEEKSHHGTADYRVNNKIFATLPGEGIMVLKLPREEQLALNDARPEVFQIKGWAKQGWTHVVLAKIKKDQLAPLIYMAWANVAPKKLVEEQAGDA
ncbi:MAG: MmcQ/YjbR family DNA-binding protein, partial [Alphaproteobacteria bacterium]